MERDATQTQIATATLVYQLGEQLNALRAERDAAVAERDSKQEVVEAAWETLGSLRAENARLREALERFVHHWTHYGANSPVERDGTMNQARAALHPKEQTP